MTLFENETKTIRHLVYEITVWANTNFDDHDPLTGVEEEVGEFAHYRLKTKQRIRKVTDEDGKDALADATIYLLHLTGCYNGIISQVQGTESNEFRLHAVIHQNIATLYAMNLGKWEQPSFRKQMQPEINRACSMLYWGLKELARMYFHTNSFLSDIVQPVWDKVSQRNWRKFSKDGLTE